MTTRGAYQHGPTDLLAMPQYWPLVHSVRWPPVRGPSCSSPCGQLPPISGTHQTALPLGSALPSGPAHHPCKTANPASGPSDRAGTDVTVNELNLESPGFGENRSCAQCVPNVVCPHMSQCGSVVCPQCGVSPQCHSVVCPHVVTVWCVPTSQCGVSPGWCVSLLVVHLVQPSIV